MAKNWMYLLKSVVRNLIAQIKNAISEWSDRTEVMMMYTIW